MQINIENLKQLINQAVDLSNEQKQEWLSLLEIMDEQQLLELEEILKLPVLPSMVDDESKDDELKTTNYAAKKLQTLPKQSVGAKIKLPEILNSKKFDDVIKNKSAILQPQNKIIPARSGINGNIEKPQTEYSQQAQKIPKMPAPINQTQNSHKQTNIGKPIIAPPNPVKQNFVNNNNLPANLPFKGLAILPDKIPQNQKTKPNKLPQIPSAKNAQNIEGNKQKQPINLPQVPKKPQEKTERESKLDELIKQKLEDLRTKI